MSKPKTMPAATRRAQRAAEGHARQVPLPVRLAPSEVGVIAALFVGQYRKACPIWREVSGTVGSCS